MENKLLRAVSLFETLMIDIMLLPKKRLNMPKNTIPTSMALKLPLRPTYPNQSLPL